MTDASAPPVYVAPALREGHALPQRCTVYLENGGKFEVRLNLAEIALMCRRAARSARGKCKDGALTITQPR